MRAKRYQHFTLVELLVVVAILSILASLLLPSLNRAKALAIQSACGNNQRQVYLAMAQYMNDYNRTINPIQYGWRMGSQIFGLPNNTQGYLTWPDKLILGVYLGRTDNFRRGQIPDRNSVLFCPGDYSTSTTIRASYGLNSQMAPYINDTDDFNQLKKIHQVSNASDVILGIDGTALFHPGYGTPPPMYGRNWDEPVSYAIGSADYAHNWIRRHRGGANIFFVDGHITHYSNPTDSAQALDFQFK